MWWVMVTHMLGAASFTWGVPVDSVDEIAHQFANNLREAGKEARRERTRAALGAN